MLVWERQPAETGGGIKERMNSSAKIQQKNDISKFWGSEIVKKRALETFTIVNLESLTGTGLSFPTKTLNLHAKVLLFMDTSKSL